jgi:N utilization substance protein B
MSRRTARETAMKLIYEYGITGQLTIDTLYDMPDILKKDKLTAENIAYIDHVIEAYPKWASFIDENIQKYSISWNIDRISKVDLAILRLAFFEMLDSDTPHTILVNEAVDLAKKYSSEKASSFINGVIGGYLKENCS